MLTLNLPNGIEHSEKSVIIKDLPTRLTKENFDRYFLDEISLDDLKHNFRIPYSFISEQENDELQIMEATFYTRYGKIRFSFESGLVKSYEVLPVDESFISPLE